MGERSVELWAVTSLIEINETGIEAFGTHWLPEMVMLVEDHFCVVPELGKESPSPELFLLTEMGIAQQGRWWLTGQGFGF